jgi:hypothetical protein
MLSHEADRNNTRCHNRGHCPYTLQDGFCRALEDLVTSLFGLEMATRTTMFVIGEMATRTTMFVIGGMISLQAQGEHGLGFFF